MEAREVTPEDIKNSFPPRDILEKWQKGEDADWPPLDDDDDDPSGYNRMPQLRFSLGDQVECRVGPDPIKGWAGGVVTQLWYREANWPPGSYAPYKIRLNDGRDIFAPGDLEQVIRLASPTESE